MFTAPKGSIPNKDLIEQAIKYNQDTRVITLRESCDMYKGDHEILGRKKASRFKNNQVVVNHAKYITDLKTGYFIGKPVTYKAAKKEYESVDLTPVLKYYDMQRIHNHDFALAHEVSKCGRYFERYYADGNDPKAALLDPQNAIIVYDDTVAHKELFAIIYRKSAKVTKIKKQDVYDELIVITDKQEESWLAPDGTISTSASDIVTHSWGEVPVTEFMNDEEGQGDFEQVKTLINAYNIVTSDRVNDKEQLVESILLIKQMDFTDDMADRLSKSRIIANIPKDGAVEFLTKELTEDQITILAKDLENAIHKVSMTPNLNDENFVGNSSGVAIKLKLLPFETSVANKERSFENGLLRRFRLFNNYLNVLNKTAIIDTYKIDVVFTRGMPQNDFEASQMINNLSGKVSDKTLIGQLSFVDDPDSEVANAHAEAEARMSAEIKEFGTNKPTGDGSDSSNNK